MKDIFKKLVKIVRDKISCQADFEKILGVYYLHIKLQNGDDLYITKYGLPYIENLMPDSFFTDKEWYDKNSVRLSGTSCTYKVKTKTINKNKLDIVIKWNRMGQDIPGAEITDEFDHAEFNTPFEEFSLIMELRYSKYETPGWITTQKPLAIYVPFEHVELWQSGRREDKMKSIIEQHKDVILDMFRPYVTVYRWVVGIDLVEAHREGLISEGLVKELTLQIEEKMKNKGFLVRDRKPHHIIVRPNRDNKLLLDHNHEIRYSLIDFELLERTRKREQIIKKARRLNYLKRQSSRFNVENNNMSEHENLIKVDILGVPYIYGPSASTNGALWVVGTDPELFDYFLPERWEKMPRTKLSGHHEIYYALTKDDINIVWKISKVGVMPDEDPFNTSANKIFDFGYNSPFEEVSLALHLDSMGIKGVLPRAIYMAEKKFIVSEAFTDKRRYKTHKDIFLPGNEPVLRDDRYYIIIWGYWNGPDDKLALSDTDHYEGISALQAYRQNHITLKQYLDIMNKIKNKLESINVEDLNLNGNHILLSLDKGKKLIKDNNGDYSVRICNFELLKQN